MYEIPLWGTAAMSHINKLESLQSKILRTIVNTPWYVRNEDIRKDQRSKRKSAGTQKNTRKERQHIQTSRLPKRAKLS